MKTTVKSKLSRIHRKIYWREWQDFSLKESRKCSKKAQWGLDSQKLWAKKNWTNLDNLRILRLILQHVTSSAAKSQGSRIRLTLELPVLRTKEVRCSKSRNCSIRWWPRKIFTNRKSSNDCSISIKINVMIKNLSQTRLVVWSYRKL